MKPRSKQARAAGRFFLPDSNPEGIARKDSENANPERTAEGKIIPNPCSRILQVCVVGEGGGAALFTGLKSRKDRQKGQRKRISRKDGRREDYPQSGFVDPSGLL